MRRVVTHGVSTLNKQGVADLVVSVAIGVIVGGRLGYCLFYKPDLFTDFDHSLPYWGVLKINEGGMASHGGMIGALLGAYIFARRWGHRFGHTADLIAFGAPMGLFFGRIANFINGELYGRACDPDFIGAVKFPQEIATWSPEHFRAEVTPVLNEVAPQFADKPSHQLAILMEQIQRGNREVIALVEPILTPRHPSQLYLAVLEGLVVFAVVAWLWRKPQRPFTIAGAFCVMYGLMRFVGEFWREPDAHIAHLEAEQVGITRGQILSGGLILLGILCFAVARAQKVIPMGGWRGGGEAAKMTEGKKQASKPGEVKEKQSDGPGEDAKARSEPGDGKAERKGG